VHLHPEWIDVLFRVKTPRDIVLDRDPGPSVVSVSGEKFLLLCSERGR